MAVQVAVAEVQPDELPSTALVTAFVQLLRVVIKLMAVPVSKLAKA